MFKKIGNIITKNIGKTIGFATCCNVYGMNNIQNIQNITINIISGNRTNNQVNRNINFSNFIKIDTVNNINYERKTSNQNNNILNYAFFNDHKDNIIFKIKGIYFLENDIEQIINFLNINGKHIQITIFISNNITNWSNMFENCTSLIELVNISNLNTHNITNISYMFFGCSNLTNISNISNWNTIRKFGFFFRNKCI